MANTAPKFMLKAGLRSTNLTVVLADGTRKNVRIEPGVTYQGDEYIKWCPAIMMPLDSKVSIESLKAKYKEPEFGKRLIRLRPPLEVKKQGGSALDPKATLKIKSKTDVEAERGKFPDKIPQEAARPPRRPRPVEVEKKPAPVDKVDKSKIKDVKAEIGRLEDLWEKCADMNKDKLLDLAGAEGFGDKVHHKELRDKIQRTCRTQLRRKIKALSE
jgi:hypothetical protein